MKDSKRPPLDRKRIHQIADRIICIACDLKLLKTNCAAESSELHLIAHELMGVTRKTK